MTVTVVSGGNWGDEGKGRIVDYLARDAGYVVRYQGGNNAGHTVINHHGTFKLHLIPSGIFNPRAVNVLGPGMLIDLEALAAELDDLDRAGIDTGGLVISDRATVCFPFNRDEDAWEEERRGRHAQGSTRRGIAPGYADRYARRALQIADLFEDARLRDRLAGLVAYKRRLATGVYDRPHGPDLDAMMEWAVRYRDKLAPRIRDTMALLTTAADRGEAIIFEAQLGALRDIMFGIYPFTSSSSSLAAYAPIGGGLFGHPIDRSIAVIKAFSTCVGAGPFVTEMPDAEAGALRETAQEYGAATGRPRRIGHFDAVATRYGVGLQQASEVALTKLDSLTGRDELLLCTAYRVDGAEVTAFPNTPALERARPVYETMPGWDEDIAGCRDFAALPPAAQAYVERIEALIGRRIPLVSVGPDRDAIILRG